MVLVRLLAACFASHAQPTALTLRHSALQVALDQLWHLSEAQAQKHLINTFGRDAPTPPAYNNNGNTASEAAFNLPEGFPTLDEPAAKSTKAPAADASPAKKRRRAKSPTPDTTSTSTGPTTTSNDAADNDTDAASDSDPPGSGSGTASEDGSDSDTDDIGSDASASDGGGATENDSDPASDASSDDDAPGPSSQPATKAGNAALPKLKKVQPAAKSKANPNSKPAKLQIEEVSDDDSDYDSDCDERPRVVPVSRCCRPGLSWLPCHCCWISAPATHLQVGGGDC
jgi:hypothetical protein